MVEAFLVDVYTGDEVRGRLVSVTERMSPRKPYVIVTVSVHLPTIESFRAEHLLLVYGRTRVSGHVQSVQRHGDVHTYTIHSERGCESGPPPG